MKRFVLFLLITAVTTFPFQVNAQNLNLISRANFSVGMEYQSLDYMGGELLYSPGGGMGIELGLQLEIAKGFAIQSTLGYQLHLAFQVRSGFGVSNKSSFNFNRKFLSLGVTKSFKLTDGIAKSFHIGTGAVLNYPGTLKRVQNNIDLGRSTYESNAGIYFEFAFRFKISENIHLDPSIRYRQFNFQARSYSNGSISQLPEQLQELNANGIELGITLHKKLNFKKEKVQ